MFLYFTGVQEIRVFPYFMTITESHVKVTSKSDSWFRKYHFEVRFNLLCFSITCTPIPHFGPFRKPTKVTETLGWYAPANEVGCQSSRDGYTL